MKKLRLLLVFCAVLTGFNNWGQQVQVTPASAPNVCDGAAHLLNGDNYTNIFWIASTYDTLQFGGATLNNLCQGNYTVAYTDSSGAHSEGFNITTGDCSNFISYGWANANYDSINCSGSASVYAQGGVEPYTYNWSNGGANNYIDGICGGVYTVTVTDVNGCTSSSTITIQDSSGIHQPCNSVFVYLSSSSNTDSVNCTGTAQAAAYGGTYPYSYSWSNGDTTSYINQLCNGTYTVTVTDANGCSGTQTITITDSVYTNPCNLHVELYAGVTSGNGNCDGYLSATPYNGVAPYQFTWSNDSTSSYVSNVCSGNYYVTVTDANGCSYYGQIYVADSSTTPCSNFYVHTYAYSQTDSMNCNGSAYAYASNGVGPYTYTWSNGETTEYINNLCAGTYAVTVTDANGCTGSSTTTVIDSSFAYMCSNFFVEAYVYQQNGPNGCFGEAIAYGNNGTAPYAYQWSNGTTTQTATNLCIGVYNVSVTDANGCYGTASITIIDSTAPINPCANFNLYGSAYAQQDTSICDGGVSVYPYGGTAPYTYQWSNGSNQDYQSDLCAGTYFVIVTDANGCQDSLTVTVIDSSFTHDPCATFGTGFNLDNVSSPNACDGAITIYGIGATTITSVFWNTGATSTTIDNLCPGLYEVVAYDQNGCSGYTSLVVGIDSVSGYHLQAEVYTRDARNTVNCDGEAYVIVSGGQAPYTYQHTSGHTSANATGLCPGMYSVLITDATGTSVFADYLIVDSALVITNEPYGDSVSTGTVFSDVLDGCGFELEDIIDAAVVSVNSTSNDSISVWWNLYTSTDTLDLMVTYYVGNLPNGVFNVVLYLFCPEKDNAQFIKVVDQIYLNKSMLSLNKEASTKLVEIKAYPNPFNDAVTIQLNENATIDVQLLDISGRELFKTRVVDQNTYTLTDLNTLSKGTYLLKITSAIESRSIQLQK